MDAWLGGYGLGRVISPRTGLEADIIVDYFIDKSMKRWNKKLVRDTFLPFEADQILAIPISIGGVEEELCCIHGNDGVLRVKDVYSHVMKDMDFASCFLRVRILFGVSFGS